MSKKHKSKDDRQQFWQLAVETWRSSGLSGRDFCKCEGLSPSTLHYWKKKLSTAEQPDETMGSPAFIEVTMPENEPALLELVLTSGNILRTDTTVDPKTLVGILSALHEVGLC